MDRNFLRSFLRDTEVLRAPSKRLATFGATRLSYRVVSPLEGKTRLRAGTVLSEKPRIITPEAFAERFQGFGERAEEFLDWLTPTYRDLLRALEYNFKNEGFKASVISEPPPAVAERLIKEEEDSVVIRCPDAGWAFALMKFTLDEAQRSFPGHVRDLERREMFDPTGKELRRRRRELEKLFESAATDSDIRKHLGTMLQEYGLFAEYEDRYLSLFQ